MKYHFNKLMTNISFFIGVLFFGIVNGVTGCQYTPVVITGCTAFEYIYPSRNDTLETKKQILVHNKVYKSFCIEKQEKD